MKKITVLFLWSALILVPLVASASVGGGNHDTISPPAVSGKATIPAAQPGIPQHAGADIMQFKAGSHIMGFKPDRVLLANTAGLLSVEFVGTKGVAPRATSAKGRSQGKGPASLGRVEYQNLWPGITLSYDGVGKGVAESTYRIQPGADVSHIKLRYNAQPELQKNGSLRIKLPTDRGWMTESRPMAWQEIGGRRRPVEVAFSLEAGQVGFTVGRYDRTRDLVIDPTYEWHTFYGWGSGSDAAYGIALDGSGNIYVVGSSGGSWTGPGAVSPLHAYSGTTDLVVLKLDPAGAYQWHTFYGSAGGGDIALGVAVESSGNVYVTGSSAFTWDGPGATAPLNPSTGTRDLFVLKLDANGAYKWHTFYGAAGEDYGQGIALDGNGNLYVTGYGNVTWNGPGAVAPLHPHSSNWEILVLKLDTAGAYQWHTFYGSENADYGFRIAAAASGSVYVTGYSNGSWNGSGATGPLNAYSGGSDLFILKLDAGGTYQWHTFYGSAQNDLGIDIALDNGGNVYVTGSSGGSWSGPGPTEPLNGYSGGDNILVMKLDASGTYQWHTFFGPAAGNASGRGVAVDTSGVYVIGDSSAVWNGPGEAEPFTPYSGLTDLTVLKLDSGGAYQWHTFFGSAAGHDNGKGIAVTGSSIYAAAVSAYSWNGPLSAAPLNPMPGVSDLAVVKMTNNSTLTITRSGTGYGTVTADNGTIAWDGATGWGIYLAGTPVTLTADAATGSTFGGWTGCDSATGTQCTVAMDWNRKPTALFTLNQHALTVGKAGNGSGSVTGGGTYDYGTAHDVTASAATGSTFTGWSGDCSGADSPYHLTMPDWALACTATFTLLPAATGTPKFTLSPASANLGTAKADTASAARTVTIKNTGTGDLNIGGFQITGTDAAVFAWSGDCTSIPAKSSCALSVLFNAAAPYGKKSAVLNISSNDPKKPLGTIKLSGIAAAPIISASPASVNFGKVAMGGTSATKTVTVKNRGLSDLTISGISVTGTNPDDFIQANNCTSVSAQGFCTISLTMNPASVGSRAAILNVLSDDPKKPALAIKLVGKGE